MQTFENKCEMLEATNPKHIASFQGHQTSWGAPRVPLDFGWFLGLQPLHTSKLQSGKTPLVLLKGDGGDHEADHK